MMMRTKLLVAAAVVTANLAFTGVRPARADWGTEDGGGDGLHGVCATCYGSDGRAYDCCTTCGLLDSCNCSTDAGCPK